MYGVMKLTDKRCINLGHDRDIGKFWERQFCILAWQYGKCFTPHQWDKNKSAVFFKKGINKYTLPDITIWTAPGEHHEIKHKVPTKYKSIGLEKYRFDALCDFQHETKTDVFYTIHDYSRIGKESEENNIEDWITARVNRELFYENALVCDGKSWVNGEEKTVKIMYWEMGLFIKLKEYWENEK